MARRRKGRAINGVLLLDKTTGISSNDILQKVKRLYFAEKAGHTGALDPLATGMLPICLGEATKFSQFLLDSDKRYRVIAKLGQRTNTSDSDGEVVETRPVQVDRETLLAKVASFRGQTDQIPSMFSALKYQGRPLYEYARQGIEVPREARKIQVYEIILHRFEDDEVELEVHCSKGTYIRTIVDDLGEMLGCGAHVTMLRRIGVANYPAQNMVTLAQLNQRVEQAQREGSDPYSALDALLLPMDTAVQDLPEVNLIAELVDMVQHGQAVQVFGAPSEGLVRMTGGEEKRFLGVAQIDDDGKIAPKRLVVYS
ncbi:tRNA pseudouridine(55) synthase TruB [Vibrio sp. V27_P1S3P104]|uniref:tRNA pseudouridine(55) synthase TruB n=1 Tax=Vibrio TaxID=662 RepID=UPI000C1664E9|nr:MULTISPECIES: tRNA pseudouridine(55) synthase TruB [Vibrio]NAW70122.1 tRNA pseudouridine(55) synthase TruB [Vibrio sp. V28_P6S34P95]NAX04207.1 tRNA pseudouridine(55) synthase TruB [Vibrio sp. V30_P3S12P165]NAX34620.1 tRNA pseudouridine(55) synthase TruB [Vibrio sp. V29_P1S30P107]NAX37676.1 tRNA pseudouridine(55) synthase TruB [Vibrio sp. V27_P1S3P104]NAX39510.1 tRNA pseudouridine(55) synthase TruB [Vibrio sp. V26_P1S5P106]